MRTDQAIVRTLNDGAETPSESSLADRPLLTTAPESLLNFGRVPRKELT